MIATASTHTYHNTDFFGPGNFYVEERRGPGNNLPCTIFSDSGEAIGQLRQYRSLGNRIARIFLKSSLLPFRMEICDADRKTLAAVRRGWTIFRSRIEIVDAHDKVIGYLKHKERSRKPRIKIFNDEGKKISEITGNRGTWDMDIIDRDYHPFGEIVEYASDSTPGATRGKDTYHISLNREALSGVERNVVLITAIAIDMLLTENA